MLCAAIVTDFDLQAVAFHDFEVARLDLEFHRTRVPDIGERREGADEQSRCLLRENGERGEQDRRETESGFPPAHLRLRGTDFSARIDFGHVLARSFGQCFQQLRRNAGVVYR